MGKEEVREKGPVKLTREYVRDAAYAFDPNGKREDLRWDTELKGFGMRLYPSGRKAYMIRYRKDGKRKAFTIGDCAVMLLDDARLEASEKLNELRRGTSDPSKEKRLRVEGETVADLCDAYLETYAKVEKKTWGEDERRINSHIKKKWGKRKADELTDEDVEKFHRDYGLGLKNGKVDKNRVPKPYEANRILALIRVIYNKAPKLGMVPKGYPNPAIGIEKHKEKKRKRWVRSHEMPVLAEAIEKEPSIYVRSALWLYLLLGIRKIKLLETKWEEIDWERQEIIVSSKSSDDEDEDIVPLSSVALEILKEIPRVEGNPHIFPGRKKSSHLVNIDKAWRRVRAAAGLEDVRLHDLRRTVGSWMATDGKSLLLIGKTLNHKSTLSTEAYAHLAPDPVRDSLEEHAEQIMEAAKGIRRVK